jgi:hypothetical protein
MTLQLTRDACRVRMEMRRSLSLFRGTADARGGSAGMGTEARAKAAPRYQKNTGLPAIVSDPSGTPGGGDSCAEAARGRCRVY